jgi:hypothetical protein
MRHAILIAERDRIEKRNATILRYTVRIAVVSVVIWVAALMAGCAVVKPACPDGRVYTEWCGCDAPVYGDDC